MENKPQKKRLTWDIISDYRGVLMGIAILAIIIFHYTDDCRMANINYSGWTLFYNKWISSSSVDTFLFLSGFGLYYSMKKKPDVRTFYKRRFIKILIPYLLIATPALIWRDLFFSDLGVKVFLKDISFITFFTEGKTWFWYILMICFCYLIFPYIFRLVESCSDEEMEDMRMMSIFTFFTLIAMMIQKYDDQLFGFINIALLRIPVFFFGCFIGRRAYEKRTIKTGVFLMMIFSIFLAQLRLVNKVVIVRHVLAFLNLSICLLIILILNQIKGLKVLHNSIVKFFEWFGKYSLELYLMHVTVRSIMSNYKYLTCYPKYELIMVAITLILSVIVKLLTNLITNSLIPAIHHAK